MRLSKAAAVEGGARGLARIAALALCLLLLVPAGLCVKVAAVDAKGRSVLLEVEVELQEGEGRLLVASAPYSSFNTQLSERAAADAALHYTGQELGDRDFIFQFICNATALEGGSAGLAIALEAVAALTNRSVRDDIVVTGGIRSDGKVEQVSSMLEKANAARNDNYFMIPEGGDKVVDEIPRVVQREGILVGDSETVVIGLPGYARWHWGVDVVQVDDLEEAAKFAFLPAEARRKGAGGAPGFGLENADGPPGFELEQRTPVGDECRLLELAEGFSAQAEGVMAGIEMTVEVSMHLNRSAEYAGLGYPYAAANEAFMARIAAQTAADKEGEADLREKLDATRERLDAFEPPEGYSPGTLHWNVAAQERYGWALQQMWLLENVRDADYFTLNLIGTWLDICEAFKRGGGDEIRFSSEIALLAEGEMNNAAEEILANQILKRDGFGSDLIYNSAHYAKSRGWFYAAAYDAMNAEGRAASHEGGEGGRLALEGLSQAEPAVEEAEKIGLGFWARQYLGNAKVALAEGDWREAHAYALMAEKYAGFDLKNAEAEQWKAVEIPLKPGLPCPKPPSLWERILVFLGLQQK